MRIFFTCLAASLLALTAPAVARATPEGCSDGTPARPAPPELWGELEPLDDDPIGGGRDSTTYNGHQLPGALLPLWSSIDIEQDVAFVTHTTGLVVFRLGGPGPGLEHLASRDLRKQGHFPLPVTSFSEQRNFVFDVDAPAGRTDLLVTVGRGHGTLTIWDTSNLKHPRVMVQDVRGSTYEDVYVAEIGGRDWAIVASAGAEGGLRPYDLTAARAFDGCVIGEDGLGPCPGVALDAHEPHTGRAFVAGLPLDQNRHLLATTSIEQRAHPGVDLLVATAEAGALDLKPLARLLPEVAVQGVALWRQGTATYLAVRELEAAQIYDLSDCLEAGCDSLAGREVGPRLPMSFGSGWQSVTFSRAGDPRRGTPILYFGTSAKCLSGLQQEWLFDVSDPSMPREISGDHTLTVEYQGADYTVDYWSWYYARNPTGFSQVMPRTGKFFGHTFYRTAWTIFDVHRWTPPEPEEPPTGERDLGSGDMMSPAAVDMARADDGDDMAQGDLGSPARPDAVAASPGTSQASCGQIARGGRPGGRGLWLVLAGLAAAWRRSAPRDQ